MWFLSRTPCYAELHECEEKENTMDYLDSGIRLAQTVLPPALHYFGRAREREARLAETEEELTQTKAQLEVLVVKNHELRHADTHVKALEKKNKELDSRLGIWLWS
jgi:cell shape-determining protein MreC